MRTPSLGLAWQLWGRHRRGLTAALACWLLFALLAAVLRGEAREAVVQLGAVAVSMTLIYLLTIFAYGFDGLPVEAARSSFPARQFTLPVRTAALVAWPMASGGAVAALAWVAWAGLVLRPCGVDVPLGWPALLLAAVLAWLQALLWTPFGLPWVRLPLALILPTGAVVLAVAGSTAGVPEAALVAVLAALLPPAYLVARAGVARTRRGDVPEWWAAAAPRPRPDPARAAGRRPFRSPLGAQVWYEWRCHGLGFPLILVGALLLQTGPTVLLGRLGDAAVTDGLFPYLAPFSRETRIVAVTFGVLLWLPPLLASIYSGGLGSTGPQFRMTSFLATRPQTGTALVAAKLWMAALSTLAAAGVTLLTALAWLLLTGVGPDVAGWWRQVEGMPYAAPAWLIALLALAGLLGLTWLHLCKGLVIGLAGRPRAYVVIAAVLGVGLIVALSLFGSWLAHHPQYFETLRTLLPWGMGLAALLKLLSVGGVAAGLRRRGLWAGRTVATVAGVWLGTAGCLLAVLLVLVPPGLVAWYVPPLGVVLALPLARILAAPLALEWNRHR
jgi:hypothetical protein